MKKSLLLTLAAFSLLVPVTGAQARTALRL